MAAPLHILFVEDSPDDIQLMMLQLEQDGFDVEYQRVETEAAFTAALDSTPDVILSDFALPQFNGLRALRLLKESGLDIPFILISGTIGEEVAVDAVKQGADDYLMKDRLTRLGAAIRHALEQKHLRIEKNLAYEALRESEERYRLLSENAADVICRFDPLTGRFSYFSPSVEKLLGYTPAEAVGKHANDWMTPESLKRASAWLAVRLPQLEALKSGAITFTDEVNVIHKDGSIITVEAASTYLRDEKGQTEVIAVVRDITNRKHVEEALRRSEARYRAVVENQTEFIVRWKPDGVRTFTNEAYRNYFGLDPEQADASSFMPLIAEEDRGMVEEKIARLLSGTVTSETFIHRVIKPDGSIGWQEWIDQAIHDESGQIIEFQAVGRDITARKQAEEKLHSQNEFLALLNDMTRAVLLSRDLDSTLHTLAIDMAKLMEADDCFITRWDPTQEQVSTYVSSVMPGRMQLEIKTDPDETSLSASVLRAGHALAVEDAPNSPYMSSRIVERFSTRSAIGVPLIVGSHKLGAAIISFKTSREFTPEELQRAEQAGAQIALALWNAQQESEIQHRLKESRVLSDIGRALGETERVGTAKVLQLIVDSARELISEAEESVIHLLDKEGQTLISQAISGFSREETVGQPGRMRLGAGVAGQVIREGITITVKDVETDPRFLRTDSTSNFRSLLVAPVQSGGRQIGTISVQSGKTNAFSEADVELIKSFGIQAAIALENTRLFETTQNSLKEVNALYRISRGLVSSLDATQLIKDSVDLLQSIFGYYSVLIFQIDSESDELVMQHASGFNKDELIKEGLRLSTGEGIVGHVAQTASPFVTNKVEDVVFFRHNPLLPDTQSEMAVPILIEGQVVGVLDIKHTRGRELTDNDLQLIVAVAEQLSVALQKANLYASLQTSLDQEQEMRSQLIQSERLALVGRLLASVSHELNNPLQAIQNALFLLKDEADLAPQSRQDLDIILAEAERMAALIERLRSAYRPIRFQDFQPVQLNTLIEDVYALMATHVRHKEIAFEFSPDPDLPPVSGLSDQIRQVVLNLFVNAVEVMEPGGRLTVCTQSLPEQNEVLMTVKDTGPGIESELLPRIFDPFITGKLTGTGLGLTITHDIIEQHHGRIEAGNDPEGGAVFSVWFPVDKENME